MSKKSSEMKITIDKKLVLAIERLETAIRYGEDMLSSKQLAIKDAIFLLETAKLIYDDETKFI